MSLRWETNGRSNYTSVLTSTGLSTGSRVIHNGWHPVYGPQRRRLRVRPGMCALYVAALLLCVLLPLGWELAAFLLPFNALAIVIHRKPLDSLSAIGREGLVPRR